MALSFQVQNIIPKCEHSNESYFSMLQAEIQYFSWVLSVVKGLTLFIKSTVSTVISLHASSKSIQPCRQGEKHQVLLHTPLGCSAAQWLHPHISYDCGGSGNFSFTVGLWLCAWPVMWELSSLLCSFPHIHSFADQRISGFRMWDRTIDSNVKERCK